MAPQRVVVLSLPRDLRLARVVLCDQAGRQVHVRVAVHQRRVRRDLVPAHRHQAHRLGAPGDDGRRRSAHDPLGGVGDGLKTRGTEAVHRHSRRADRHARSQARDSRDVHALFRLGHRAPQDDVVDLGRVELTGARQCRMDRRGGHVVWARGPQRARRGLADGGSHCRDNHCVFHRVLHRSAIAKFATMACLAARPRKPGRPDPESPSQFVGVLKSTSRSSTASPTSETLPSNRWSAASITASSLGSCSWP